MLYDIPLNFTTDAAGVASVTAGFWPGPCKLVAVIYDYVDADTGADLTVTSDNYLGTGENLLVITNAGVADGIWYPRRLVQGGTGADLTGTSGGDREMPMIVGRPKLTVAQGGNTKTGTVILVVELMGKGR